MKSDARVRYTKRVIKETFVQLLKVKPVRSITVKEICEISEINRSTFYKHFLDVYDVLEQVENDLIEQLVLRMDQYTGRELLLLILQQIQSHQDEIMAFLERIADPGFLYRIAQRCYERLLTSQPEKKDAAYAFLISPRNFGYFAGGIGGVIGYWVKSGMKESPEEIADSIEEYTASLWR